MWTYRQSTGVLDHDGAIAGVGYSGALQGKNNPAKQGFHNVGPIPQVLYKIGEPFDSMARGPHCLHLIPDPANEMFGRSGFLMHGDSIEHMGCASEGCIIMARSIRDRVSASGDNRLQVIE